MEDKLHDVLDGMKINCAKVIFGMVVWKIRDDAYLVGEEVGMETQSVTATKAVDMLCTASKIW